MKKSDFHFELPEALIAQAPLPERSASRLLVVPPGDAAFADRQVRDLPEWLAPGDLLLIGTGARLRRPARALTEALGALGIGLEPMDSRAAARTYNLLAGEGRRVAAALYPLDV